MSLTYCDKSFLTNNFDIIRIYSEFVYFLVRTIGLVLIFSAPVRDALMAFHLNLLSLKLASLSEPGSNSKLNFIKILFSICVKKEKNLEFLRAKLLKQNLVF